AVPGDLGGKNALVLGDQCGDAGVLPAALRLAARGDRAEQGERLVVVEDLLEQTPGRKHRDHLFRGLAGEESNAGARPGQQVCRTTAPHGGRTGTTRTWAGRHITRAYPRRRPGVVPRDGRGGEDPRAPTTAVELQARPARSRASVPARSDARRSSRVNPAGARVRVVTPAAA